VHTLSIQVMHASRDPSLAGIILDSPFASLEQAQPSPPIVWQGRGFRIKLSVIIAFLRVMPCELHMHVLVVERFRWF